MSRKHTRNPRSTEGIQSGWHFFYQGDKFLITDMNQSMLTATDLSTGQSRTFDAQALMQPDADGHFALFAPTLNKLNEQLAIEQPLFQDFIDHDLPEKFLDQAQRCINIVEAVTRHVSEQERQSLRMNADFRKVEALETALDELEIDIGLTTFYKYLRQYDEHNGNLAAIASSLRRSTWGQLRINRVQLHLIDTLILEYYARPQPMAVSQLIGLAQDLLKRTQGQWVDPMQCGDQVPADLIKVLLDERIPFDNIVANPDYRRLLTAVELPSDRWIYGYIKHFTHLSDQGQQVITARYGAEEWERRSAIYDEFMSKAVRLLQYVFADHALLDVYILDEDDQPVRLWVTILIDAFSRDVLGFALLDHPPSIMSILTALRHAIFPKTSHIELGLTDDWPTYGIPQHLSLDNAWAHHSYSLEDAARSIGLGGRYPNMILDFRPPYRARYGAIIERLIGNLSAAMKAHLTGAIQSSNRKHIANARKNASLLYEDIYLFLHEYLLHYRHSPHSGLDGMTPHEKWLEGMSLGLPLVPPLNAEIERFFWRLDPKGRCITNKGISVFGMDYTDALLGRLEQYDRTGARISYSVRYDPNDISRVALFRNGRWLGDVYAKPRRLPDGSLQPLSLTERALAQDMARKNNRPAREWLKFTNGWQRRNEQRAKEASQRARQSGSVTAVDNAPAAENQPDTDRNTTLLTAFLKQNNRR